jgi:hypothetical protein
MMQKAVRSAAFAFGPALAAARHDDHVLRRIAGRIGLLDGVEVFDGDSDLHERIWAELMLTPSAPQGPPRDELLQRPTAAWTRGDLGP